MWSSLLIPAPGKWRQISGAPWPVSLTYSTSERHGLEKTRCLLSDTPASMPHYHINMYARAHTHTHRGRDVCVSGGTFQLSSLGRAKESSFLGHTPPLDLGFCEGFHSEPFPTEDSNPAGHLSLVGTEEGWSAPTPILLLYALAFCCTTERAVTRPW